MNIQRPLEKERRGEEIWTNSMRKKWQLIRTKSNYGKLYHCDFCWGCELKEIENHAASAGLPWMVQSLPVPDSPLVRSHQLGGNLRIHKFRPLPHRERFFLFIHQLHKGLHLRCIPLHPADLGHKILLPWLKKEKAEIIWNTIWYHSDEVVPSLWGDVPATGLVDSEWMKSFFLMEKMRSVSQL